MRRLEEFRFGRDDTQPAVLAKRTTKLDFFRIFFSGAAVLVHSDVFAICSIKEEFPKRLSMNIMLDRCRLVLVVVVALFASTSTNQNVAAFSVSNMLIQRTNNNVGRTTLSMAASSSSSVSSSSSSTESKKTKRKEVVSVSDPR